MAAENQYLERHLRIIGKKPTSWIDAREEDTTMTRILSHLMAGMSFARSALRLQAATDWPPQGASGARPTVLERKAATISGDDGQKPRGAQGFLLSLMSACRVADAIRWAGACVVAGSLQLQLLFSFSGHDVYPPVLLVERIGDILRSRLAVSDHDEGVTGYLELFDQDPLESVGASLRQALIVLLAGAGVCMAGDKVLAPSGFGARNFGGRFASDEIAFGLRRAAARYQRPNQPLLGLLLFGRSLTPQTGIA